jgi:hypothetical protein
MKPRVSGLLLIGSLAALVAGACLTGPGQAAETAIDWSKARQHWSFRPPVQPAFPAVRNARWLRQPVDRFILAKLEQKRLAPSPEADPRTLIRRVTLDLTGLPPTPAETAAFLKEREAEKQDRRAGPDAYTRLVERLLASPRFGERFASMWLPLARYAEDQAHQVGTDTKFFYPNAHLYRQWVIDAFNRDLPYDRFVKVQLAADQMGEAGQADLAALGFLGLGPKYYNRNRLEVQADEWQDRVDTVTRTFLGLTVACARCHDHKYDPITAQDYYALAGVFASTKMVNRAADGTVEAPAEAAKVGKDTLHVVQEDTARDLNLFIRGNVENKGPVVPRRFLQVLSEGVPPPFHEGSGREELADRIAGRDNPLTARVMVNRIWGQLFGVPLVGTPSNFGLIGERPTHPALLDDLALRFMRKGWSVKSLVRELVLSAAYRQSSAPAAPARGSKAVSGEAVDPSNRLLWRMNRRRLSIEQWRDSVLFVSGRLESGGGPSRELTDPGNFKRTVYSRISRLKLNDLLMQFDYPDANVHAERRAVTTTPIQKLFLLNSALMQEQARHLAARLAANGGKTDAERVEQAYVALYNRPPLPEEKSLALAFLSQPEADGMPRWERYAQVLLVANEMLYVD